MTEGGEQRKKCSSTWYAVGIRCPFFRSHSPTEIRCEGFVDKSSSGMLFERRADKMMQQHTYCEDHYEACELYRAIVESKYSDDV